MVPSAGPTDHWIYWDWESLRRQILTLTPPRYAARASKAFRIAATMAAARRKRHYRRQRPAEHIRGASTALPAMNRAADSPPLRGLSGDVSHFHCGRFPRDGPPPAEATAHPAEIEHRR